MPPSVTCDCALCHIETQLLSELYRLEASAFGELFLGSTTLWRHSSVSNLLAELKSSRADATSDELFHELLAFRGTNRGLVDSLLLLSFLPVLHGTVRRVAKQQPGLQREDIAQQALRFLLEYLGSADFQARRSHLAFAISRAVKRQLFPWAKREGGKTGLLIHLNGEAIGALAVVESFERYALLRHFLHRCVTKGVLADSELDLVIELKLNGTNGEEFADLNGTSSNAVRQRLKRLLAKLRRYARRVVRKSKLREPSATPDT
jgi:DNA-directed RNA polymerase specialized sigma24 family protein